jgi:hypothetical protein
VYGKHPGFAWGRLPGSLEAILFDQEFGFLVYAPIFALALPGLWLLARRSRWQAWLALVAPALVLIGTAATWRMWWGGFAPPGRFLVPLLPALAVGVAAALRSGLSASSALLIGWSVFMGLAGASEPRLVHRDRDGSSPLLREFSGAEEWTRLLPRFIPADADPRKHELALVWAAALALAVAASRRPRACTALRLGLACAGLCATAAIASSVSVERTGGRDAVRVIGRPALTLPDWTFAARAEAAWGTDVLDWGPAYEPHHHTGGAVVGSRLALPPGRYLLELGVDPLPGSPPPLLEVAGEGAGARFRRVPVTSDTWSAAFEVSPGEPAVTLRLQGGGPLILRELRLRAQPPPKPAGPSLQQGRTG